MIPKMVLFCAESFLKIQKNTFLISVDIVPANRRQNFWKADLSEADVVFCYLYPDVMKKLAAKLASGLKPGAVVVSSHFSLPGFAPSKVLRLKRSLHSDPVYIYHLK